MADKDINIHIRAQETEQTKAKVGSVEDSVKKFQQTVAGTSQQTQEAAQKQKDFNAQLENAKRHTDDAAKAQEDFGKSQDHAAGATDKTSQKLSAQEKLLGALKTQILGFIGAALGIGGIQKVLDFVIQRFERMSQLMRETYDKGIALGQVGQALEFQTGTIGQQRQWTFTAANLQQKGGLANIDTAQQMLISGDIAFSKMGGIKNPQVVSILEQLAPFVGAGLLKEGDVAKLFSFMGAAGIDLNATAYKEAFAKIRAGYTASKSTDFGQFVTGLQTGVTGYIAMGGTFDEAIASYSSALAVQANEALAATLMEQVTRLSSGGYEKPRQAIERAMKVKWDQLSMDERKTATLGYVASIPEAQRGQKLSEAGFPVEMSGQLTKIVSEEATRSLEATREAVQSAKASDVTNIGQAYMQSDVGKARSEEGRSAAKTAAKMEKIADWQSRLRTARTDYENLADVGADRFWTGEQQEIAVMALEDLVKSYDEFLKTIPQDDFYWQVKESKRQIEQRIGWQKIYPSSILKKVGLNYNQLLTDYQQTANGPKDLSLSKNLSPAETSQQVLPSYMESQPWEKPMGGSSPMNGPVNITHNNDNSINIYPSIGNFEPNRMDFNE